MTYSIMYKDAAENTSLTVDWTSWLMADTIGTSTWSIPSPLVGALANKTTATTYIYLDGGVLGQYYNVTNTITTVSGRTSKRTFVVRITSK